MNANIMNPFFCCKIWIQYFWQKVLQHRCMFSEVTLFIKASVTRLGKTWVEIYKHLAVFEGLNIWQNFDTALKK